MSQNYESPNETAAARLVPYSQRWHHAKIIIRILIICLCALSYGLCFLSIIYAIGLGPIVIADVAWTVTEFIALAIRRAKKRGIHPIAHLVLDTLFPPAYLFAAVMYGDEMANSRKRPRNFVVEAFIIIFVVALMILHSVLFVRSCIEVHQRRLSKGVPKTMYYIPGQGAPFVANREPLEAELDAMPAAARRSVSTSSLPDKEEPKAAGSCAQLAADRV
ncbi:hypothetical protein INS49_015477 [Diaporthe citri]|uniref:uncharacterized protein n=1 Tax=Diaporthe citri TaxID=83186 RepID=UPI001C7FA7A1|nr:uncharacterized protein INS49_015477 [Diaporthe citri]KAG6356092.1 hypothetical protein INS49_015477 [Diaporthe citri]